ncbi:MAG: four helix bundle protein [Gemmatimonadaceae bacterium]
MSDFRKLDVWRKAHELAVGVDRAASGIRAGRYAALRHQMVRAAISIPANIVEGSGQESRREFARFLRYAMNSASELEYHLILARDVRAVNADEISELIARTSQVRKMLTGLIRRVAVQPTPITKAVEQ